MTTALRYRVSATVLAVMAFGCAASLPAAAGNPFDGKWTVENSSATCMVKSDTWTLIVRKGSVTAAGHYPPTGSISPPAHRSGSGAPRRTACR